MSILQDEEIIQLPKLVDSSVSSGIITLNNDFKNEKERTTKISLTLLNENRKFENYDFLCDYSNLTNISYKLRSTCNQIEESVKTLGK